MKSMIPVRSNGDRIKRLYEGANTVVNRLFRPVEKVLDGQLVVSGLQYSEA